MATRGPGPAHHEEDRRHQQHGGELGDRQECQAIVLDDGGDQRVQLGAQPSAADHQEERGVVGDMRDDQQADGQSRHVTLRATQAAWCFDTGSGSPLLGVTRSATGVDHASSLPVLAGSDCT